MPVGASCESRRSYPTSRARRRDSSRHTLRIIDCPVSYIERGLPRSADALPHIVPGQTAGFRCCRAHKLSGIDRRFARPTLVGLQTTEAPLCSLPFACKLGRAEATLVTFQSGNLQVDRKPRPALRSPARDPFLHAGYKDWPETNARALRFAARRSAARLPALAGNSFPHRCSFRDPGTRFRFRYFRARSNSPFDSPAQVAPLRARIAGLGQFGPLLSRRCSVEKES